MESVKASINELSAGGAGGGGGETSSSIKRNKAGKQEQATKEEVERLNPSGNEANNDANAAEAPQITTATASASAPAPTSATAAAAAASAAAAATAAIKTPSTDLSDELEEKIKPIPDASSLFVFSRLNRFRLTCHHICNHRWFSNSLLICILVSSTMLAAEDPVNYKSETNDVTISRIT